MSKKVLSCILVLIMLLSIVGVVPIFAATSLPYSENFDDGAANDFSVISGTWDIVTDGTSTYHSLSTDSLSRSVVGETTWDNYAVEAKAKVNSWGSTTLNTVGVLARYTDTNNYYIFAYEYPGELRIKKKVAGTNTTIASVAATITPGTWYTIKGVVDGSDLSLYVNGVQQLTVTDNTLTTGKSGLISVYGDTRFDDYSVTSVGTPTPTPTPTPTTTPTPTPVNLALNKTAMASSVRNSSLAASYAVDGSTSTRWGSNYTSNEWIYVDLGSAKNINNVKINWGASYASQYKVQVSNDASGWTDVYSNTTGDGGIDDVTFTAVNARYVKMLGVLAATSYGYSIYEMEVYGSGAVSTPTPTPTPAPTTTPAPTPGSGSAPVRLPSYGANGTHWPSLIPTAYMYDDSVPNIINVACSWSAIGTAIASVTPEQAAAGVLIKVAPGNLVGNGSGSGNTAVLQNLGSSSWSKRVTVCPRDGYGTVTFSGGLRILNVRGVCFAGFSGDSIKLQGCDSSALAWTKVTDWLAGYGLAGQTTTNVEFCEVVMPDSKVVSGDASDFYSVSNGNISNWLFDGCYIAPHFYAVPYTGDKPHTDSLQFAGSGGTYSNMTIRDAAIFSSNNCAVQTGATNGLNLDHSYIVGGDVARSRYPFLPGGATEAGDNAFNGEGTNFTATDSIFYGGQCTATWSYVSNTRTNYTYAASQQPATGSWTVDTTLSATNPTMPPYPTDSYLSSIWSKH